MDFQFFEGKHIILTAPDADRDAETESKWTHDPDYLRLLSADPAKPLSPAQVKKRYEEQDKAAEKERNAFNFAIRLREGDRLIGFIRVFDIAWTHGTGRLQLGIGDASDRGQGYGGEALKLVLRYAFDELNLHRLSATTFEYNPGALRFLERPGFTVEVRRRQAVNRDGRRWDVIMLGLLRDEWKRDA
ncbi:MAG TPA: GNAT family protein [Anaerolineae bacterium]|nr:GNAT family protein [Anaerolineae bacterium]